MTILRPEYPKNRFSGLTIQRGSTTEAQLKDKSNVHIDCVKFTQPNSVPKSGLDKVFHHEPVNWFSAAVQLR